MFIGLPDVYLHCWQMRLTWCSLDEKLRVRLSQHEAHLDIYGLCWCCYVCRSAHVFILSPPGSPQTHEPCRYPRDKFLRTCHRARRNLNCWHTFFKCSLFLIMRTHFDTDDSKLTNFAQKLSPVSFKITFQFDTYCLPYWCKHSVHTL